MKRAQQLRSLDAREKWTLVKAAASLSLVRVLLSAMSMRRARSLLSQFPAPRVFRRPEPERVVRLVHAAANRRGLAANCVPRAVTSWFLLERGGVDSEIRFGVEQAAVGKPSFSAHAWVEIDGEPVGEPAFLLQKYARLGANDADAQP